MMSITTLWTGRADSLVFMHPWHIRSRMRSSQDRPRVLQSIHRRRILLAEVVQVHQEMAVKTPRVDLKMAGRQCDTTTSDLQKNDPIGDAPEVKKGVEGSSRLAVVFGFRVSLDAEQNTEGQNTTSRHRRFGGANSTGGSHRKKHMNRSRRTRGWSQKREYGLE